MKSYAGLGWPVHTCKVCVVLAFWKAAAEEFHQPTQDVQASTSFVQLVLALQQRRRAAGSQPQTVRAGSLPAEPQLSQASCPSFFAGSAGPPLQRQMDDVSRSGLPWTLPMPALVPAAAAAANAEQSVPPRVLPAWAQPAPFSQPHAVEHLQHRQPQHSSHSAADRSRPQATPPPCQNILGGFWQQPPPAPQVAPTACLPPAIFSALQPPSQHGAAAATPGFLPLAAALQRRHTWSSMTAPIVNPATNPAASPAAAAALTARLLPHAGPPAAWAGILAQQQQVTRGCASCTMSTRCRTPAPVAAYVPEHVHSLLCLQQCDRLRH